MTTENEVVEPERNEDGTVKMDTDGMTKAEVDAENEANMVEGDSTVGVGVFLATGKAPVWATDPTTNKNTAQRYT